MSIAINGNTHPLTLSLAEAKAQYGDNVQPSGPRSSAGRQQGHVAINGNMHQVNDVSLGETKAQYGDNVQSGGGLQKSAEQAQTSEKQLSSVAINGNVHPVKMSLAEAKEQYGDNVQSAGPRSTAGTQQSGFAINGGAFKLRGMSLSDVQQIFGGNSQHLK